MIIHEFWGSFVWFCFRSFFGSCPGPEELNLWRCLVARLLFWLIAALVASGVSLAFFGALFFTWAMVLPI